MCGSHPRSVINSFIAILCLVGLLTSMAFGSVSYAVAEDTWETWPKKPVLPPELTPIPEKNVPYTGRPSDASENDKEKKTSSKTLWWVAAGIAAVVGIAIAVGSGGGGGGETTVNPGHH
jgi:hypothetical protein